MSLISNIITYFFQFFQSSTTTTPAPPTAELPKCRFRLDNNSSATLTLPDGRKLGYAQYGSPTGRAILYQHGLPGSRLEAATFHDLGLELDARIIAVDRPGIGWSTPHPTRTLLDHPKDLEYLAEHLKLETYSVLGVSGGGPYALACAASLPSSKLTSVAIVCGLAPPDVGMSGANWMHWLGFTYGYRYAPYWLGRWFWRRDELGRVDLSDEQRLEMMLQPGSSMRNASREQDHDIVNDTDILRLSLRASREAFAQGYDAVWDDARLMCLDWGFRVEDVRKDLQVQVQLWYGKFDTFVPLNHGLQIAARLGGRAELRVEDEAHSGIFLHWKKEILQGLISKM